MGWLSQQKGAEKERLSADWLKKQGVRILSMNYRCKGGEIDIIGIDKSKTLIFFEVKYRKNTDHGNALDYITPSKQKKIILCANAYLSKNTELQNHSMRFDALTLHGNEKIPNWLKDIFGAF